MEERAVRLVFETAAGQGEWHGAVGKVAKRGVVHGIKRLETGSYVFSAR